jgi:hypothetical protein
MQISQGNQNSRDGMITAVKKGPYMKQYSLNATTQHQNNIEVELLT